METHFLKDLVTVYGFGVVDQDQGRPARCSYSRWRSRSQGLWGSSSGALRRTVCCDIGEVFYQEGKKKMSQVISDSNCQAMPFRVSREGLSSDP